MLTNSLRCAATLIILVVCTQLTPPAQGQTLSSTAPMRVQPSKINQAKIPPAVQKQTLVEAITRAQIQGNAQQAAEQLANLMQAEGFTPDMALLAQTINGPTPSLSQLLHWQDRAPQSAIVAQALGHHYWRNAQWPEAHAAFLKAHHLAPNHPDPIFSLGVCLQQLGQKTLAEQYFALAIKLLEKTPSTLTLQRIQAQQANTGDEL